MQLNLITSNKNKVKEFRTILGDKVQVNHIELEYPELRSDDPLEIAKEAAQRLSSKLNKTIVVEDSGLFIEALKGFPGTCSSYIHKRIGLQGILKLMEGIADRIALYRSAVALGRPQKNPIAFLGEEKGSLAAEIRGSHGFGHDPLFIPEGGDRTYGEMEQCESIKKFRKTAVLKLRQYLEGGQE
jgi:XTP/dITP diphosphohydrolase